FLRCSCLSHFFFTHTPTPHIYTLSLHDALPILLDALHQQQRDDPLPRLAHLLGLQGRRLERVGPLGHELEHSLRAVVDAVVGPRSEEHTSELQSRSDLVCRLLLEKKKKKNTHQV